MKLIFDIGGNEGNNIAYYLHKADCVVVVEANPNLCEKIKKKFYSEIKEKRVFVENGAISESDEEFLDFYICKASDHVSTILKPSNLNDYEIIRVKSLNIKYLLEKYGYPEYIKVDIENTDKIVIEQLIRTNFRPRYISVESHRLEIFCLLSEKLGYKSFNLVDGWEVGRSIYQKIKIFSKNKKEYINYSFSKGSAGPFGKDLKNNWYNKDSFLRLLGLKKLGWKDIHATNQLSGKEIGLLKLFIFVGFEIFKKMKKKVYWKFLNNFPIRKFNSKER